MMILPTVKILSFLILMIGIHNTVNPDPDISPSINIRYGDLSFTTSRILETSPGLFRIMNFDLVSPLANEGEGVVIPLKTKNMIFGENPALGKTIYVDSHPLLVVGIVRDIPENSYLWCDLVILSDEPEIPVETLVKLRCLIIL